MSKYEEWHDYRVAVMIFSDTEVIGWKFFQLHRTLQLSGKNAVNRTPTLALRREALQGYVVDVLVIYAYDEHVGSEPELRVCRARAHRQLIKE